MPRAFLICSAAAAPAPKPGELAAWNSGMILPPIADGTVFTKIAAGMTLSLTLKRAWKGGPVDEFLDSAGTPIRTALRGFHFLAGQVDV